MEATQGLFGENRGKIVNKLEWNNCFVKKYCWFHSERKIKGDFNDRCFLAWYNGWFPMTAELINTLAGIPLSNFK